MFGLFSNDDEANVDLLLWQRVLSARPDTEPERIIGKL